VNVRREVVFRVERSQRPVGWGEYTVPVEDHTTVVDAVEWI
jgi:succinate dehydrogenase/fumarate reductase-like Fe-S protein